ncbi:hypothetical protein [Roseiconus lacunae]|uniref:Uncharacterized protein n=1 Tax=Roseiconus lacunae TaxID=2605694 RepID=A0ABT7PGF8_9BACT|nr:hypothetical protein [Roseiconus lacunae]MDM4015394.1 hypothetical protein [Roseiconus lacunae]
MATDWANPITGSIEQMPSVMIVNLSGFVELNAADDVWIALRRELGAKIWIIEIVN